MTQPTRYAWLVWGTWAEDGQSKPLGCYATRDAALEAERLCAEHENGHYWTDFSVTPWVLETEPRINFRMAMKPKEESRV
jgi:hypothetical protein